MRGNKISTISRLRRFKGQKQGKKYYGVYAMLLLCLVIIGYVLWLSMVIKESDNTVTKLDGVPTPKLRGKDFNTNMPTEEKNIIMSKPVTEMKAVGKPHPDCLDTVPNQDDDSKSTNRRHMVPPPQGPISLVCCITTFPSNNSTLNIEVHHSWAPIGANRFMSMVKDNFFSPPHGVALFRALKGFLVQFGLSSDPDIQTMWHRRGNLQDDPSWLPLGPTNREHDGVKRFRKGYMAYAGAGKNSRGTQLIMALQNNGPLCGGSPWEVPWGQVVSSDLWKLDSIFTEYGEKVHQSKIMNRGYEYLKDFSSLDYLKNCKVTIDASPSLVT